MVKHKLEWLPKSWKDELLFVWCQVYSLIMAMEVEKTGVPIVDCDQFDSGCIHGDSLKATQKTT